MGCLQSKIQFFPKKFPILLPKKLMVMDTRKSISVQDKSIYQNMQVTHNVRFE